MYLAPDSLGLTTAREVKKFRVSSLLEKGSGRINEDQVLVGTSTYGVFDGATSLQSSPPLLKRSGGRVAADICKNIFANEKVNLLTAASSANSAIGKQSRCQGVNQQRKEELWSCSAAVIRLEEGYFDWCQIGDCQIMIIADDGSYRLLGHTPDQDVETLKLWQQKERKSPGTIFEVMSAEIKAVRCRANIDFGVFNGEPEAMDFLGYGRESLSGVRDILLFSDGLLLPQRDPCAEPDWQRFISLYEQGGLGKIRNMIRSIQRQDPACLQYPRFKTHDDISGVALTFG